MSAAADPFFNPFLMWSRLVWKGAEMAIASAQVIGYRTHRLALAGPVPNARDRREFTMMGQEKGEAMLESAQATAARMMALNQELGALVTKQLQSTFATFTAMAMSRTPAASVAHQSRFVGDTVAGTVVAFTRISGSTARIARSALNPVHSRLNGNVRRLRIASK